MSHYPQHHQQQQHQHYQPPSLPTEDDQFRSFFRSHLATLTVNSRPIIQSLTQVAADQLNNYSRATVVSEELVRRIHEAPPHQKLPPFYLLDSISKNFPAPYASLFPPYLQLLFLATYGSVDGSTKAKMEEMLKTWRNGGVGGGVVFGVDVQEQIEQRIWGVSDLRAQQAQQQQYYQAPAPPPQQYPPPPPPAAALPPAPTKDALLLDLATALHRSHQLQLSPSPPLSIANDILALQSLQALIQTQPTTDAERRAIEAQLRKMEADAAALLPPPPPPPAPPAALALPSFGFLSAPGFSDLLSNVLANTQGGGGASPRPSTEGDAEYVVPEASDDEGEEVVEENEVEVVEKVEDVEEPDEYERLILGLNVQLEKLDLKAPLPRISTIIATLLPSQCRQCSVRAPASAKGRARLDTHMDWHYRHNKRARDSEGRGNSRAWFVDAKDWIKDPSISPDSFLPSSNTHNPSSTTSSSDPSSSQAGGLTPAARQALMKKFVVQPTDTAVACPICKESFKGEYSDEEEEWIWKNAVEFEGTIYHATCRHETLNASSSLLATTRLRTTAGDLSTPTTRSRSNSPAVPPPAPPPRPSISNSTVPKPETSPLAQQQQTNGSASLSPSASELVNGNGNGNGSAAEEVVVKVEEMELGGVELEKVGSGSGKRKSIEPASEEGEGEGEGGKKIKLSPPEEPKVEEVGV